MPYRSVSRCAAALAIATTTTSLAAAYDFDVYRRAGDVIDGSAVGSLRFAADTLTLNNAGQALFLSHASDPSSPFGYTLHTGNQTIARVGQPLAGRTLNYIEPASVSLNNAGHVAFIANHVNGSPAVYLNGQPVLDPGAALGSDVVSSIRTDGLELNDAGGFAAYAEVNGTPGQLNTGTRAVVTGGAVVARVGQTIGGQTIRDMNWDAQNITVNLATDAGGRVAFFASTALGGGTDTLFTQNGGLAPLSDGPVDYGANFRTIALNDAGGYAFVARENDGTPANVVMVDGAVVARGGQTASGKSYVVSATGALELNEGGSVGYFVTVSEGNQTSSSALAVNGELLLGVGDVIDGYTVSRIHPDALGFNDFGQALVAVTLLDGSGGSFEALVYGAPVPEPTAAAVCACGSAALLLRRRRR